MLTDPPLLTPDARRIGAVAHRGHLSESVSPGSRCAEWLFVAQPRSVPEARRLIAISLHHLPNESLQVVLLLASELMSNAVLHGAGSVGMHLGWDGTGVRVGVTDQSPTVPVVSSLDLEALGGRGLLLVDDLSSDWGVLTGEAGQGKTVWFTLDT